ncbi:signal peptide peptidase SppA [Gracilibacillus alcaliphilus]|uniref:signal peptide peptidase SppA n=1 Tax=Gracilibacillus alcaliphilus TaxID=1401441 RepID=UPI00195CE0DF|nr:signal peptide peptidase SppA [Gracilibacillus alcaliphilus]MBM7676311.1 protease-4 [Gracilibacillus alcaliphilus]
MNKKRWLALAAAAGLFLISVGFQFMSSMLTADFDRLFSFYDQTEGYSEKVIEQGSGSQKIAVLHVDGVIQDTGSAGFLNAGGYNHQAFLEMLDQAGEDSSVGGVILRVNTPGGGVVESAEIHDKIVEIKEMYDKPVYVSMGNTAASGGYYISAPVDKIVAHNATLTGSIGVIMESYNFSELADQLGIDVNTIKSGEHKDIMSMYREMSDEERDLLQAMIDDMYNDFVQVIVDGRDMPEDRVRELGDGRVYTGSQAQAEGLVDELGSFDDTVAMMKEEQNLANASLIEYSQSGYYDQLLGGVAQSLFSSETNIFGLKELLQENNAPRAMYLYSR